ncbi:YdjY domain-containing protein [Stieleria mannarensis]|uniref:YdjY domain-containing protein n=1 Tax=Stieleria mannarensis TaxID=2755585 RepID=UPI00160243BE|nr:YdjY domain-containing protein [Rhodopirellula sp. JC639]
MNKRSRFGLACLLLCVLPCLLAPHTGCGRSEPGPTADSQTKHRPASSDATDPPHGTPAATTSAASTIESPAAESPAADPRETTPQTDSTAATDDSAAASGRPLPSPPEMPSPSESTDAAATPSDDAASEQPDRWEPEGPTAEEVARQAFQPPPETKSLSQQGQLWIDPQRKRVIVDGYVALKRGALEMFACPVGTKEHESIVAALARSREVHAALLAVDATPGAPVRFRPEFVPPTGQVIRVWVCWYDTEDQFHVVDARQWVQDLQTEQAMTAEWVFAGSGFWQDEETKQEHYMADSGDMICVSNFSSAMLDVAIPSSADTDSLRFVPFESKIPDRETPVRLILVPVPASSDDLELPTSRDVPRRQ